MNLPEDLRSALSVRLYDLSASDLAKAVTALSSRYRAERAGGDGSFLLSPLDVAAYAAYRLPATFAAIHAALDQVRILLPDWQPQSLLDCGAGPGSAAWAATQVWQDLGRITLVEDDVQMIAFGKQLAAQSRSSALRDAVWLRANLTHKWESAPHDLIVAGYVLGEIPPSHCAETVESLWASTTHSLVLVEPGTPTGFAAIRQARQALLHLGARMVAPCPHEQQCPIVGNDWCHFSQRISRSRLHRTLKEGTLPYEDEKFSYLAVSRQPGRAISGRVLRHPQVRSGHITLELCTTGGLCRSVVTRKDGEAFRSLRDVQWGSAVFADYNAGRRSKIDL